MPLIGHSLDVIRARAGAWVHSLLGLQVGHGVRIYPGTLLRYGRGCVVAERCVLYRGVHLIATAGGTFEIGARSHIAPHGYLLVGASQLRIGEGVAIGPFLGLFCESNGSGSGVLFCEQRISAPVSIGSNVFIGAHVTILPGAVVEDDVVIGANSVVRGRLNSGWIYAGSPASPVRRLRS
jgi:acetyltransferase-like isoleucine patch superfamily enzyme